MSSDDAGARLQAVVAGLGLALGGLIAALGLSVVGAQLLVDLGVPLREDVTVRYPVGTVLTGLAFGLVVAGYVTWSDRRELIRARVPTLRDLALVVAGVVALVGALLLISLVLDQLGITTAQHRIETIGREHPTLMLVMLPLAFLVIGPSEELLFRAAIQGRLRDVYRPVPAIVIASALFAIGHVFALAGTGTSRLSTVVVILLLGAILGAVYEFSENVVVPSLVHGAYDAIAFAQIYATATGLV